MNNKPSREINKRRYYLHRAVRKFARVQPYQHKVLIPQGAENTITPRQLSHINELKAAYGYQVQYAVPGTTLQIKHRISKRILVKLEPSGPRISCKELGEPIATTRTIKLSRREAKGVMNILMAEFA